VLREAQEMKPDYQKKIEAIKKAFLEATLDEKTREQIKRLLSKKDISLSAIFACRNLLNTLRTYQDLSPTSPVSVINPFYLETPEEYGLAQNPFGTHRFVNLSNTKKRKREKELKRFTKNNFIFLAIDLSYPTAKILQAIDDLFPSSICKPSEIIKDYICDMIFFVSLIENTNEEILEAVAELLKQQNIKSYDDIESLKKILPYCKKRFGVKSLKELRALADKAFSPQFVARLKSYREYKKEKRFKKGKARK